MHCVLFALKLPVKSKELDFDTKKTIDIKVFIFVFSFGLIVFYFDWE